MMESGYVNTNIKTNTNTNTNKSVHLVNKCGGSGRSPRQSSAIPRNISHRKGFCQCYPGWYGTTCSVSCPRCSQAIPGAQRTRKATGTLVGFSSGGPPFRVNPKMVSLWRFTAVSRIAFRERVPPRAWWGGRRCFSEAVRSTRNPSQPHGFCRKDLLAVTKAEKGMELAATSARHGRHV